MHFHNRPRRKQAKNLMKKDGKFGGPHGYVQTAGGPIMAGYKGPHISASPYDRHQFAHYAAPHQYPSVDQVAMGYTAAGAGGVQYPGHQQQYGDFPPNVYPNYYAAAAAGLPGLSLPHHVATTAAGQVASYAATGESPTVSQAAYQPPAVVSQHQDPQEHHQSCSSSQGNSPDVMMMAHQAVNPAYLQVSGSQGDSPQQEVTSQAQQQQHYQQQYQVASNQAM